MKYIDREAGRHSSNAHCIIFLLKEHKFLRGFRVASTRNKSYAILVTADTVRLQGAASNDSFTQREIALDWSHPPFGIPIEGNLHIQ